MAAGKCAARCLLPTVGHILQHCSAAEVPLHTLSNRNDIGCAGRQAGPAPHRLSATDGRCRCAPHPVVPGFHGHCRRPQQRYTWLMTPVDAVRSIDGTRTPLHGSLLVEAGAMRGGGGDGGSTLPLCPSRAAWGGRRPIAASADTAHCDSCVRAGLQHGWCASWRGRGHLEGRPHKRPASLLLHHSRPTSTSALQPRPPSSISTHPPPPPPSLPPPVPTMRFLLALLLSALLASASATHVCNSGWDRFFQAKQGRHRFGDSYGERVGRRWRPAVVLPAGAAWCGTGCVRHCRLTLSL